MKKIIILQHNGGDLANQLWGFIAVYAYSLEHGYDCRNYSFFEYSDYFDIPVKNLWVNLIFFKPFRFIKLFLKHVNQHNKAVKIWRKFYRIYVNLVKLFHKKSLVYTHDLPGTTYKAYYLPPSQEVRNELLQLDQDESVKKIYFHGWLFRNPVGMIKYRKEILQYFKPKQQISHAVYDFMHDIRSQYDTVIGVHIRQGDYKTFKNGIYYTEQERVREIIDEYMSYFQKNTARTCVVVCSDGIVDKKYFEGLNVRISKKNVVEDLFILSSTDTILGSDSSLGNLAAYLGNIPHIIFKKENIDWEYYRDKKAYFENKHCTMVHF